MNKNQKGFTLIELLVVVSIISLLSSIVFAALNSARAKARDAIRKQTLVQLRNALELYYTTNGSYPETDADLSSEPGDNPAWPNGPGNNGIWIPGLVSTYISALPRDPLGGNSPLCGGWKRAYVYNSDGKVYKLLAHCSPEGTISVTDSFRDPVRPNDTWMVCSGEPACSTW